jgi:hypothetical protein
VAEGPERERPPTPEDLAHEIDLGIMQVQRIHQGGEDATTRPLGQWRRQAPEEQN